MHSRMKQVFFCAALIALVSATPVGLWAAGPTDQKAFATPDAAVKALVTAAGANDTSALLTILGPDGKDLVSSGDAVADRRGRKHFVEHVHERCDLVEVDKNHYLIRLGNDDWNFPIPIVKSDAGWRFDTAAGKQELINRRIGRNELTVIDFCHVYVDAQRAYAATIGHGAYAQHFISAPGKHDGLYWPVTKGEAESPLGPAVAEASAQGYQTGKHAPFHGYHFHLLTAQGAAAPTGARKYIGKDGRMTHGFALVAWPDEYGVSGVMTFLVNQCGIVYQKDLGPDAKNQASMTEFNPDKTWTPVRTP